MARDEFVQSAIDNWAPRFISNGVDANDFQRITNSVERWDDWCQKWSECGFMHEQMGEKAEAQNQYVSAAYHYFHAAISYHFGKYLFVRKPQELRVAHEHVVNNYQRALPFFDFPGEHVAIPYERGAINVRHPAQTLAYPKTSCCDPRSWTGFCEGGTAHVW